MSGSGEVNHLPKQVPVECPGQRSPAMCSEGLSSSVVGDAVIVLLSSAFQGAVDFKCCVNREVANSVESVRCEDCEGVACSEEVSFEGEGVLSEEVHDEYFIIRRG